MRERKRKQWLKAIRKLRCYYDKYQAEAIPVTYGNMLGELCPLCRVARSPYPGAGCDKCLWHLFREKTSPRITRCTSMDFWKDTATKRIARLDRWTRKLLKEGDKQ